MLSGALRARILRTNPQIGAEPEMSLRDNSVTKVESPAHPRPRQRLHSVDPAAGRVRRCAAAHAGFALVEAVIALLIFAIVSTAIVGLLVSSTSITTLAKERTVAEEGVTRQIEQIRSMDYKLVGTTSGNPAGRIPASVSFTGLNGEPLGVSATMTTAINNVGAEVPGAAQTGADFKKVTVTITRNQDSKVLARAVTYLAPKTQASQTTGTIQATVVDIGNNTSSSGTALQNVRVTLTPPSGLNPPIPSGPESDTTDPAGTVTFAGLTPTSGSQVFNLGIASADLPYLYTQLPVTAFGLAPTQFYTPTIQIYQPVTLYVALYKQDGTPWVGSANITVTQGSGGTSHTYSGISFTSAGTSYAITTLSPPSGQPLLPDYDYFVSISASGFEPVSDNVAVPLAGTYPATSASALAYTFSETMLPAPPAGELDVTVQMTKSSGGTLTCKKSSVVVAGGPQGSQYSNYTASTSSSGGAAKFANPPDTNIVANIAPYDPTPYSVSVTTTGGAHGSNNNVSVNSSGPTSLTVNAGTTSSSSC